MGLIIDLFACLFAVGLLAIAAPLTYRWYQNRKLQDPKQRLLKRAVTEREAGVVNHLVAKYDQTRLCTECKQMTNHKQDLFLDGDWIHTSCYTKLVTGEKK